MRVETKTSIYELSVKKVYVLKKIELKPGNDSIVKPGDKYNSEEIYLMANGCLCVGDMHTSPVQNYEGVKDWILEH